LRTSGFRRWRNGLQTLHAAAIPATDDHCRGSFSPDVGGRRRQLADAVGRTDQDRVHIAPIIQSRPDDDADEASVAGTDLRAYSKVGLG
jgi:hypothetical protein